MLNPLPDPFLDKFGLPVCHPLTARRIIRENIALKIAPLTALPPSASLLNLAAMETQEQADFDARKKIFDLIDAHNYLKKSTLPECMIINVKKYL